MPECLQLAVSSRQLNADDLAFRCGPREKRGNTVRYFGAFALRAPMLRRRMLGEVFGALEAFAAFLTTVQVGRHVVPPLWDIRRHLDEKITPQKHGRFLDRCQ